MDESNQNEDKDRKKVSPELRARNIKLAIALGVIALGIYVIFLISHIK